MPPESASSASLAGIAQAIVETLAYSDVFDYPLTIPQIRRYLVRIPSTNAEVAEAVSFDPWLSPRIERHGDKVCLVGRSATIPLRDERARYADRLWWAARRLAWIVAHLPFVRMVAVIGSLTMDNVRSPHDDIDLLIVTAPGRVWLARALTIALVRLAELVGIDLCPNYLLSTQRLAMEPDDLFTARELAQMIPLYGRRAFTDLLAANRWLEDYLPNAEPRIDALRDLGPLARAIQRAVEWPLTSGLGESLEQRIRAHRIGRLRQQASATGSREVVLEPDICKGHMDSHGGKIRTEYARRCVLYRAPVGDAASKDAGIAVDAASAA